MILTDLALVLLVVGGWFAARFAGDLFSEKEYIVVSEVRTEPEKETASPPPVAPAAAAEEPAPETEPAPEEDPRTEWQIRFAEHFTPETGETEDTYSSPNLSVRITHHTIGEDKEQITYHLADIYMGCVDCFRAGLAKTPPRFHMSASLLGMMETNDAVVAVNGDFCGFSFGGTVVRNGVVYSSGDSGVDLCVLYRDGRMETHCSGEFKLDQAIEEDVFQVWSFGPALLEADGSPRDIPWPSIPNVHISGRNPRTAIGYFEPGHYCFLVVDGRQIGYSRGATLEEMSQIFSELGCRAAFNLDGGGSSMMGFQGRLVSQVPSLTPRNLSDCLYIADIAPSGAEQEAADGT